jgi:ribosomal protein S18 acetylase RimI-like enzyme
MQTGSGKSRRVRVRAALLTDAGRIAELSGQLGYPTSARSARRRLHNLLAKPDHAIWVAQSADGSVTGWVHVFFKQLLESDREAEIGGLVVDGEFRGEGVGKALVERAERWAKAKRLKSVYVRSNIVRRNALAFYQGLGYEVVKTQRSFRKCIG